MHIFNISLNIDGKIITKFKLVRYILSADQDAKKGLNLLYLPDQLEEYHSPIRKDGAHQTWKADHLGKRQKLFIKLRCFAAISKHEKSYGSISRHKICI